MYRLVLEHRSARPPRPGLSCRGGGWGVGVGGWGWVWGPVRETYLLFSLVKLGSVFPAFSWTSSLSGGFDSRSSFESLK